MQDSYGADTVSTALRAGLSLPHDLKLATIGDDFDIRVDDLGLTAVALDWQGFIDLTFERLRDRLENLHAPPVARRAEHRLIVRGLCGAPADQVTRTTGLLAEGIEKPKRHFISRWRLEE
jgi:DNA-binding LacI/PurR family transcriptional regulator